MRKTKEVSKIAEKTIKEILKHNKITNAIVSTVCDKYKINESFIRIITGFSEEVLANRRTYRKIKSH